MDNLISLFQKVLHKAKDLSVSDVHLSVGSPWKFRQHGHVAPVKALEPLKMAEADAIVRHIITQTRTVPPEDIDKFVQSLQDFDCSYSLAGVCRFRVNICRQRGSFAMGHDCGWHSRLLGSPRARRCRIAS